MTPNTIFTTFLFAVAIGAGTKASANDGNDLARLAAEVDALWLQTVGA